MTSTPRKLRIPAVVQGPDRRSYTHDGRFVFDKAKGWVPTTEVPKFFLLLAAIDGLYYAGEITLQQHTERRATVLTPTSTP